MTEIFNEMNSQMLNLPNSVQMWMNWMMVIFFSSIFFVWKQKGARLALLSFLLTIPLAMLVFYLSKSVHLIGIAHFLVWAPLLVYLYRANYKSQELNKFGAYGIWTILLMLTIVISLIFDARDIVLVILGKK